MVDPCRDEQLRVINFELLNKAIQENFPAGEAGRLTKEEGLPYDEVQEIRLDYSRILRIDHLWVLSSLTKLHLNNNLIERIENLDALVHLSTLDLSFNKITKIENLDSLVNLTLLCLSNNLITKIENMDQNKNLLVFNIGHNLISERENILYLRWFKELESFSIQGNPCCDTEDFEMYTLTFLKQLHYFENLLANNTIREAGATKYEFEIREVEKSEENTIKQLEIEQMEQRELEANKESFVEFLSGSYFFKTLFEEDREGSCLLMLGEEVKEYHAEFQQSAVAKCNAIFQLGQDQYALRKKEFDEFKRGVEEAKAKNQHESIAIMEEFLEDKNRNFINIVKSYQRHVETGLLASEAYDKKLPPLSKLFDELVHKNWKKLMGTEMTLFAQMEECNETFERTMSEMINTFIEAAQAEFTQIRSIESTYTENVTEVACRMLTLATVSGESNWPKEIDWIMFDKDTLTNVIAASHDLHMLRIDVREDTLMTRAKNWLENLVGNLQKDEIARNRLKVLELNYFFDKQTSEFENLIMLEVGPIMDPDVSAALG